MIEWTGYIKIFTTLLAIVNPLGVIPIFVSLTRSSTEQERRHIARTTSVTVAVILITATLFGKPLLKAPIENYFGLGGIALFVGGTVLAVIVLVLGLNGWDITRLWLYLLGSAMLVLVGVQLLINWFLMRILSELSQRSVFADQDLNPIL